MVFTTRPVFRGVQGVVAAGHYLAAAAGFKIFLRGGNAIDAAAAASFAMTVIEPHLNGIAGEAPILIYSARDQRVFAVSGQGVAPREMTPDKFKDLIPGEGVTAATVPALVDAWLLALREFGQLPLPEILAPALSLAEDGWPAQPGLVQCIEQYREKFEKQWPTTAAVFLPAPRVGQRIRNPGLARLFKGMLAAAAAARDRLEGLEAARRYFYEGPVAEAIDRHSKALGGYLRAEDLARYRGHLEDPVSTTYRDTTVFKCGPWTQGPVFLQTLNLLEGYDLPKRRDYLHLLIEAMKLAFADREYYYGDGADITKLLSKEYAAQRRQLIAESASELICPGGKMPVRVTSVGQIKGGDTTHVDAADRYGNLVAATPSGGWIYSSPVVEDWGFPLGTRGQMFSLDPRHPNALAPGKRPRTTLTPTIAFRGGRPWLAFGTPGGDQQEQWTLQFFLNVVDFGMNLQEAIDAPTVHTTHFPSSFWPRAAQPRKVFVEGRISAERVEDLRRRGHDVEVLGDWENGRVTAVALEEQCLAGAASPRKETAYVMGW